MFKNILITIRSYVFLFSMVFFVSLVTLVTFHAIASYVKVSSQSDQLSANISNKVDALKALFTTVKESESFSEGASPFLWVTPVNNVSFTRIGIAKSHQSADFIKAFKQGADQFNVNIIETNVPQNTLAHYLLLDSNRFVQDGRCELCNIDLFSLSPIETSDLIQSGLILSNNDYYLYYLSPLLKKGNQISMALFAYKSINELVKEVISDTFITSDFKLFSLSSSARQMSSHPFYDEQLDGTVLYEFESTVTVLDRLSTPIKYVYILPVSLTPFQFKLYLYSALCFSLIMLVFFFLYSQYTANKKACQLIKTRYAQFLENSHDAIVLLNYKGRVLFCNPAACTVFRIDPEQINGLYLDDFIHSQSSFRLALKSMVGRNTNLPVQSMLKRADNTVINCSVSISRFPEIQEILLSIDDNTHSIENEKKMHRLAYFDSLTELHNRLSFTDTVSTLFAKNRVTKGVMLFIDLDGFKAINDNMGHSIGDRFLQIIASRLRQSLNQFENGSKICRFGGDEFVVWVNELNEEAEIARFCQMILKFFEPMVVIDEFDIKAGLSIGVSRFPQDSTEFEGLLRKSDAAMYASKQSGKHTFTVYNEGLDATYTYKLRVQSQLINAIHNNEFYLCFQPIVNLVDDSDLTAEVLIRWNNAELGPVGPDIFIDVAEETGLIHDIGDWVIDACLKQLKQWRGTPLERVKLAINISAIQLAKETFIDDFLNKVDSLGVDSSCIELELTERAAMTNIDQNVAKFSTLKERGIGLSMDDFGTGHSSLSFLNKLTLTKVKIDKSFIDNIESSESDLVIVKSVLQLADTLQFNVVAEGVETMEQLKILSALDCQFIQGYLFSKPLPADVYFKWVIEGHYREIIAQGRPFNSQ